jgi:hypothetical protein
MTMFDDMHFDPVGDARTIEDVEEELRECEAHLEQLGASYTRQRDQLTVMREALEIANACGGLCVECVRRINAALARCTP